MGGVWWGGCSRVWSFHSIVLKMKLMEKIVSNSYVKQDKKWNNIDWLRQVLKRSHPYALFHTVKILISTQPKRLLCKQKLSTWLSSLSFEDDEVNSERDSLVLISSSLSASSLLKFTSKKLFSYSPFISPCFLSCTSLRNSAIPFFTSPT